MANSLDPDQTDNGNSVDPDQSAENWKKYRT